jgi:5-formyltetrahydrofolate cyclo-ligase
LRQYYRAQRTAITKQYREEAAQAAVSLLQSFQPFLRSQKVACYFPVENEFDSRPLIDAILKLNKLCYLPVLDENQFLYFVQYGADDLLVPNRFNIPEPKNKERRIVPADLDLVITPLVAFDKQGNRLGTGGGYYDRTFAFLREDKHSLFMLGVGFAIQEAQHLMPEPWDIKLNAVLTEKEIILPTRHNQAQ